MPYAEFTYQGRKHKLKVPEDFKDLTDAERKAHLLSMVREDKPERSHKTGSAILDTLALLERPAQALKVGLRETGIGGYDPTPEGFLAGMKKGFFGEDQVRTQEFMSEEFREEHPWLAGIGGFVGDVLTDPLTYTGAGLVRGVGKAGAMGYRAIPGSSALTKGIRELPERETLGPIIQGIGRGLNIPVTQEARAAKRFADMARAGGARKLKGKAWQHSLFTPRELKKELSTLEKYFRKRAKNSDHSLSDLHQTFIRKMERSYSFDKEAKKMVQTHDTPGLDKILGADGVRLAEKWSYRMHRAREIEELYNLRIPQVGQQLDFIDETPSGYFPRVVREEARERAGLGREGVGGGMGVLGYRHRLSPGGFEEAQKHYKDMYGIEQTFFDNPVVALGVRLDDHHKAIQKQWVVDQLTDMFSASTWTRNSAGVPLNNIGKYIGKDDQGRTTVLAFGHHLAKGVDNAGKLRKGTEGPMNWSFITLSDDLTPNQLRILRENNVPFKNGKPDVDGYVKVEGVRSRLGEPKRKPGKVPDIEGARNDPISGRFVRNLERPPHLANVDALDGIEEFYNVSWHAPKEVAKAIEGHMDILGSSKKINDFLKFYDAVQNGWKGWSLAVRPAYHIRNVVGNMFNAYTVAGVTNPAHFINAFKLQLAGSKGELSLVKGFNGIPGESMDSIVNSGRRNGVVGGQYSDDIRRTEEQRLRVQAGDAPFVVPRKLFGQDNPAVNLGFTAGEALESNARWGVYLAKLKSIRTNPSRHYWEAPDGTRIKLSDKGGLAKWGTDPKQAGYEVAARDVKEALFDYTDISAFERDAMKRTMPFYTWTRKNIPAQLKHLVLNPQRAEKLELARQQFEYAGGRPEYRDIAPFWGNRVPIFFGKESQGVRHLFTLLNTIPLADLERLTTPWEMVKELASPFIKEPLEQLANYDTFRKKAMREYKGEKRDFLGIAMPARLWHLVQLLVPIAEINRVNPGGLFGEQTVDPTTGAQTVTAGYGGIGASRESGPVDIGAAARMVRFFTGGRAYDINIQQQRAFRSLTLMKDLRRLQSMLKWAAYKGEERRIKEIYELIEAIMAQEEHDPFMKRR